jgi:3-oxoacyl-[acyl-carrier protein] reductase
LSASGPEGRVAIVTGAGGGLGGGICYALTLAGAAVAAVDLERDKAERAAESVSRNDASCVALEADVSDCSSVEGMAERVAGGLGGVGILVNNAAIYPSRPWTEITEGEWGKVLAINLKGYFMCARAAFPYTKDRGHRRVINVASITFFVGFASLLDYVSSKRGVVGFTRSLAREVGPEGITVNAISPGAFPTDAEKIHPDPEGYNRWVLDQQGIKRRGTPEDIGNLVPFLVSDAASFITGQTIEIDGGWAMH